MMMATNCLASGAIPATNLAARSTSCHRQCSPVVSRPLLVRQRVRAQASDESKGIETSGPNMKPLKDIQAIMDILPHRYPFLLVDRVLEWEYGKYAVGYKCVTINDNFFPGHFPQRAIMPGVLQVEALAQLAGIVMLDPEAGSDSEKNNNFFFGGVDNCKWRKPVVPGDVLMMRVDVTKVSC
jgi:3-hydroxyacyl-[acyl-carrier-protein] dehydratase